MSMRAFEYIFRFFIIDYRNLRKRCSENRIWVTSEMRLSHFGITFESPRTLNWSLILDHLEHFVCFQLTLISDFIPRGPEHACVWIYISFFFRNYQNLLKRGHQNCIWATSEVRLSHLGNASESPRNLSLSHSARNYVWVTSELRLNDLDRLIGRYHMTTCNISCASS